MAKKLVPVGVAIFEDVPDVMKIYVPRFEHLKGIALKNRGVVNNADGAIKIFRRSRPSIVITDLSLGEHANTAGFTILHVIKEISPRTAVALSTCYSSIDTNEMQRIIEKEPFDAVFNKTDLHGIESFILRKAQEFRHEPMACVFFQK